MHNQIHQIHRKIPVKSIYVEYFKETIKESIKCLLNWSNQLNTLKELENTQKNFNDRIIYTFIFMCGGLPNAVKKFCVSSSFFWWLVN